MSEVVLPSPPAVWTPDYKRIGDGLRLPRWARPWERTKEDVAVPAYGLVGVEGTVVVGTSAAAITPAYGQTPTANNLLALDVTGYGSATLPSAPSGWSVGKQVGAGAASASIFYKIAAGSDSNPTVAAVGATVLVGKLYEFSGNDTSSPLDKTGTGNGTTSTIVGTNASADVASGQLVMAACASRYSAAATKTLTDTFNNGATATSDKNNATSTANHYSFSWGITTSAASADTVSHAQTTTSLVDGRVALASFLLASASPGLAYDQDKPQMVGQAVKRSAFYITGWQRNRRGILVPAGA